MSDYYLIERRAGEYLSDPSSNGTGSSFTRALQHARRFRSLESARHECCDNEHPVPLDTLLGRVS
jgi:hypothetical protein